MISENNTIQNIINEKKEYGTQKFGEEFEKLLIEILALEKMLDKKTVESADRKPNLIPLAKWNEHHAEPTVYALRGLIQRNTANFIDSCIEYRGSRILINEDRYFEWVKNR